MMEKLGQAKTHLELKKMIAEVDTTNSGKHSQARGYEYANTHVLTNGKHFEWKINKTKRRGKTKKIGNHKGELQDLNKFNSTSGSRFQELLCYNISGKLAFEAD